MNEIYFWIWISIGALAPVGHALWCRRRDRRLRSKLPTTAHQLDGPYRGHRRRPWSSPVTPPPRRRR